MKSKADCCYHTTKEKKVDLCSPQEKQNNPKQSKKPFDYILIISSIGVSILFVIAVFFSSWAIQYQWIETMANTVYYMVGTMWWGVVIGAIFVGLLSKIPRQFILSIFGKGGSFSGLLRATGAGIMLDVCCHGILIVAAKLYERGVSAGQVIAFLLASPWNSFSLTFVLITLIGLKWTLLFIILSMLIALVTGAIFDKLVERKILPANHNQGSLCEDFDFWNEAKKGLKQTKFDKALFKEMIVNGIKDSKMVVRWLMFGVLVAAVLRVSFDSQQFEQFFGPTFLGLVITLGFATVIEVCSEGSAPIAADIITRAKAPGNGFAFLMAGVATDYTEIIVIKNTTRSWKLALFLPMISVPQILLVAWIMNIYR